MKKFGLKETKISKIHKDPEKFSIYIISKQSILFCYAVIFMCVIQLFKFIQADKDFKSREGTITRLQNQ